MSAWTLESLGLADSSSSESEASDRLKQAPVIPPRAVPARKWALPSSSSDDGSGSDGGDCSCDESVFSQVVDSDAVAVETPQPHLPQNVIVRDLDSPAACEISRPQSKSPSRPRSHSKAKISGDCLSDGEDGKNKLGFVRGPGGTFTHSPDSTWKPLAGCEWWQKLLHLATSAVRYARGPQKKVIKVGSLMTGLASEFICLEAPQALFLFLSGHGSPYLRLRHGGVRLQGTSGRNFAHLHRQLEIARVRLAWGWGGGVTRK
jgi:hypothetical protein